MSAAFEKYIGIDYSGAETCESSLRSLRVYMADQASEPREVARPPTPRKHWTRKAIAQWLVERLSESTLTLVGIDHGFSFPLQYFKKYRLSHNWPSFLNDFQKHWPTDEDNTYVDFVREGECGNGAARCGDSRWRRITEVRAGAKSVFHFDVPGSVAKSTHAGIPWLRFLRARAGDRVHFWPFDGWRVPPMAPRGIPLVLEGDVEGPKPHRQKTDIERSSGSDLPNGGREPQLGHSPHPRRTSHARFCCFRENDFPLDETGQRPGPSQALARLSS